MCNIEVKVNIFIHFLKLFFQERSSSTKINRIFISYFQDQWNILDLLGCGLFYIGFILKTLKNDNIARLSVAFKFINNAYN